MLLLQEEVQSIEEEELTIDWCIRGNDPIILHTRAFSQHPLRVHGDAVIAGFAELRLISVSLLSLVEKSG